MGVPRFVHPLPVEGVVDLAPAEAHHAAHVLRMRSGEAVELFDGEGGCVAGRIEDVQRARVSVRIQPGFRVDPQPASPLTLAVAPPKGARQQVLVEKCTELGAAEIRWLRARFSVVRAGEGLVAHGRRWALEACRQSGRNRLPEITDGGTLAEVLAGGPTPMHVAVADTLSDSISLLEWVARTTHPARRIVLIGPEGGWTDEERDAARRAGAVRVSLGRHTLRVETAAIAAAALLGQLP